MSDEWDKIAPMINKMVEECLNFFHPAVLSITRESAARMSIHQKATWLIELQEDSYAWRSCSVKEQAMVNLCRKLRSLILLFPKLED
jgi:hypothetical protein